MEKGPSPITRPKSTYTTNPKKTTSPQAVQEQLMGQRPNTQTTRHPTTSAGPRVGVTRIASVSTQPSPLENIAGTASPQNSFRRSS
ncbi:hypothetical protein F2Q70_00023393 [Brassica cretica]|uniref:Uncharacterized protein n=1 Tax=Brassica cretica TaxID=69181 RepID=A0A8S9GQQ9_BRACR|nr:hypothetical protein F2Q70_00023393 [Brassica cretica]